MSILIKGMAMPKNCGECRLNTMYGLPFACDGWCFAMSPTEPNSKSLATGTRPSWCPLVELPPHGDLIDRDALMKDGWLCLHKEVMRMGGYAVHELPLINPSIPVVIEKENC